jgi:hypothetical protein
LPRRHDLGVHRINTHASGVIERIFDPWTDEAKSGAGPWRSVRGQQNTERRRDFGPNLCLAELHAIDDRSYVQSLEKRLTRLYHAVALLKE